VSARDWPDIAGELTPEGHRLPVRVYYEDTDFSGLVYHASYVRFLERGRSDFLRLLGIGHREFAAEPGAPAFAVRRMTVEFHRPARIDDLVMVETSVQEITGSRLILRQAVTRGADRLVEAEVTVVVVDQSGRPRRIPALARDRLTGSASPPA
jgi:acyl-CoA thioester hydrolase